eukprot:3082256-Rhodomonas_salina.3
MSRSTIHDISVACRVAPYTMSVSDVVAPYTMSVSDVAKHHTLCPYRTSRSQIGQGRQSASDIRQIA